MKWSATHSLIFGMYINTSGQMFFDNFKVSFFGSIVN